MQDETIGSVLECDHGGCVGARSGAGDTQSSRRAGSFVRYRYQPSLWRRWKSPARLYKNDFVELYNRGLLPQSRYMVGQCNMPVRLALEILVRTPDKLLRLSGIVGPGQYFLVQEAAGTNTFLPLPTPNILDPTPINMSGTGGKVALANTSVSLGCNGGSAPCSPAALAQIVDLVGWDGANFYEGAPAPATTNSTAILRLQNGVQDTDNNLADFVAGTPTPRNTPPPDFAPSVVSTNPAGGDGSVLLNADVSVTFSEPVNVTGSWFDINCEASGSHSAVVTGGPETFTINPDIDFSNEACTLTIIASNVTDIDTQRPAR